MNKALDNMRLQNDERDCIQTINFDKFNCDNTLPAGEESHGLKLECQEQEPPGKVE